MYVHIHCLRILSRIRDNLCYPEITFIMNTKNKSHYYNITAEIIRDKKMKNRQQGGEEKIPPPVFRDKSAERFLFL